MRWWKRHKNHMDMIGKMEKSNGGREQNINFLDMIQLGQLDKNEKNGMKVKKKEKEEKEEDQWMADEDISRMSQNHYENNERFRSYQK
uniref:Uncharacterized protein n=1 Tax=Caenorhabditis tropicalis TaxID=1561998 RepID=A0A1I7UB24_9PELO